MYEPVTTTRSVEASAAAGALAFAAGSTGAALVTAGACANALAAMRKGTPTPTARAERRDPSLLSTCLIISFSIGLVRFGGEQYGTSKIVTRFFFTFFKKV